MSREGVAFTPPHRQHGGVSCLVFPWDLLAWEWPEAPQGRVPGGLYSDVKALRV